MDSIYSRNRIKIPKLKMFYSNNGKTTKVFKIIIILIITIITFYTILKAVTPIFNGLCVQKAMNIATETMNYETNRILQQTNYNEVVTITKENDGTNLLKTDVVTINKIASDIALACEKSLKELENETINIPIGSLTGNKYLAGSGPKIKIKVIPTGNIVTELKTEFESKGINQTIYRIYLELKCKTNILTAYNTLNQEIINQVLLVETLVIGDVPQTYYNLDNLNNDNILDIIE